MLLLSPSSWGAEWQELKGDHFIVYYKTDEKFAKDILRQSEGYYKQIASDLGYARYSNFWQWDNRVKIYVYPSEKEFQSATGELSWSKGVANYTTKEILTFAWSQGFLEALLPHEITHLVFRDFVGFKGEVPLWLDEGVAQWEEPAKRAIAKQVARSLIASQKYYPLRDLTSMDIRNSKDEEAVQFFYMQSVTVVEFLIKKHGAQSFTEFCRQLRDGKSLEEALRFTYSASMRTLEDLQSQWIKYVMEG